MTWLKALTQLGFRQTSLYAWYQWGLKSGYLRWRTLPPARSTNASLELSIPLPDRDLLRKVLGTDGLSLLYAEADEIVSGKIRLFKGEAIDLELKPPGPLKHWTLCKDTQLEDQKDIKLIWEPGRFEWAMTLARAYFLSQDERYPSAFWKNTEVFLDFNPAYQGLHWVSAQEVALRLTSFVFAYQIFATSSLTFPERASRLAESIAQHAARIPPTLAYARAQNNNHLLTEAMGLITAARVLPTHPSAKTWHTLGWKWFHKGLQSQIAEDGNYNQHSANYHRLMLQAALWVYLLAQTSGEPFPEKSLDQLAVSTRWLLALLDPLSGSVPNLGPNDGAYIFPLSVLPFQDFRPVLQAAGKTFLGAHVLHEGIWDEMSLWLCNRTHATVQIKEQSVADKKYQGQKSIESSPHILKSPDNSWAYLRIAHFTSRPGHADQLHLDLWWRGLNIALDPGTYFYNAPAPWDNALASTLVHNTVSINGKEQMSHAGRFLYLDWAQAEVLSQEYDLDGKVSRLVARHNGYRRFGIVHQRSVSAYSDGWRIEDQLINIKRGTEPVQARLHWMVPDWEWNLDTRETGTELRLHSPFGWITLKIWVKQPAQSVGSELIPSIELVRAGQILALLDTRIDPPDPTWGWISPTYGTKNPALSLSAHVSGLLPLTFVTNWDLQIK